MVNKRFQCVKLYAAERKDGLHNIFVFLVLSEQSYKFLCTLSELSYFSFELQYNILQCDFCLMLYEWQNVLYKTGFQPYQTKISFKTYPAEVDLPFFYLQW